MTLGKSPNPSRPQIPLLYKGGVSSKVPSKASALQPVILQAAVKGSPSSVPLTIFGSVIRGLVGYTHISNSLTADWTFSLDIPVGPPSSEAPSRHVPPFCPSSQPNSSDFLFSLPGPGAGHLKTIFANLLSFSLRNSFSC